MDKQPTILIVDDEVINLNILADAFKEHYHLLVTKSGAQGLVRAMNHDVDLVLLDIMLPDMDGYEVCKRLKENEKTRHIPVIFITTKTEGTDEEIGLQAGAVDYIGKPFYLPMVRARVETHIALKQKSDLLEKVASLDGVTCLANRRRFDEYYTIEYKRALRDGSALSIAMVDIDYFKPYNDNYGYAAGDKILKMVGELLSQMAECSSDMVARYGGDDFLLVMPNTSAETAANYCRSLVEKMNEKQWRHLYSPISQHLSFSIGGTTFTNEYDLEQVEVFEKMEQALFKAKNDGRNRVVWFV